MTVEAEQNERYKEEHRPERRARKVGNCFGICDESETGSGFGHVCDGHALFLRHEAEHGEDDEAGEEARAAVDH